MTQAQARKILRDRRRAAGTITALAGELGVSKQFLSGVLLGKRPVSDNILAKLGIERVTTYRRKGRAA